MAEKECSICHKRVALELFENDKRRPDGKGPRCKPCIKAKSALKKTCAEVLELKKIKKAKEQEEKRKEEPHVKATNECDCGHLLGSHMLIKNPDGPGNTMTCWKGTAKDRCQCRNYSHNGQKYGDILNE